ncbi:MAG TPA: hypothetical protein ENJ95_00200 [Bacteroidetes bacterium]|nr:hypothetical protein [Bacteroidota bacterium]
MNKTHLLTAILVLLTNTLLTAQNEFEPTPTYPYGQPNPEAPNEIKDYQPLIGICDCKSYKLGKDNEWQSAVNMTWEFKYIMNGMAVQDQTLKEDGIHSGSIRQFNADSSSWYVHYYTTAIASPGLRAWKGGKKGDEIILYSSQKSPNGIDGFYKIRFFNISDKGFNWLGEWVDKDETIAFPTWKIECKKRVD